MRIIQRGTEKTRSQLDTERGAYRASTQGAERGQMIKTTHYKDIPVDPAGEEGAKEIGIRWLITERDGAPNFAMRVIEVAPGGHSPYHQHPWEHEVFILEGAGTLVQEEKETRFSKGDVIFVPPDEWHQFKNTSQDNLEFICLIPNLSSD
jgi:quercetin dioxygenase-like cupin family protein